MKPEFDGAEIRVLLVDDQAIVGEAVRRMLTTEADIRLDFCQDPAQALGVAVEVGPTVILQDLVMPGADGLSLLRYYRAHPALRDVPLIVLSSKEEPITKAEAFRRGANDYLVKLPDPIELVARIRHHSRGYVNLLQRNEAYAALLKSREELAAEIASAAEYVKSLLPAKIAENPVRTDWRFVPSAQLGGDSFGYHWIDDNHFAMYLLDVCGHGVGAALLSVTAMNVLRSSFLPDTDFRDPAQVMRGMNRSFRMEDHNNLYFTMWYGVYESETRTLRHGAAGHPPALLSGPDNIWRQVLMSNIFIGALPDPVFQADEISIEPGASLYLISDGVYEVDDAQGQMWGLDNLQTFLSTASGSDRTELDALYAALQQMHGPVLEDDFSIVRLDFC
jgi:sigma-B regulation protein RsbU (phosphoserine phosphatase)